MVSKKVINHKRLRKIQGSFSWIDHRFITDGFLENLSTLEILLYLFLVSVSDRNGISFYHDDRVCHLLKIDLPSFGEAREGLITKSLIASEPPVYQVLALPKRLVSPPPKKEFHQRERKRNLYHIQKIKEMLK
jgi:hypothetical protein